MPREKFPSTVGAFVTAHVRSLDELQLLMTIIQSQDRWWDAETAAREIGMSVPAARSALDYLAARNLLDMKISGDLRYQFRPGTPELNDAASAAAEAYRRWPMDVARLVAEPARRTLSDFADAFRIRRDDDR